MGWEWVACHSTCEWGWVTCHSTREWECGGSHVIAHVSGGGVCCTSQHMWMGVGWVSCHSTCVCRPRDRSHFFFPTKQVSGIKFGELATMASILIGPNPFLFPFPFFLPPLSLFRLTTEYWTQFSTKGLMHAKANVLPLDHILSWCFTSYF